MSEPLKAYDAFISYSHAEDRELSRDLQTALERFGGTWLRPRGMRIYRDETNLQAAPDLWDALKTELLKASYFLLLASPGAARSEWVPREVELFAEKVGRKNVCIVLTRGSFPGLPSETGEIVDAWTRDDCAISRGVYALLGNPDKGFVVDLRRLRERSQRRRAAATSGENRRPSSS